MLIGGVSSSPFYSLVHGPNVTPPQPNSLHRKDFSIINDTSQIMRMMFVGVQKGVAYQKGPILSARLDLEECWDSDSEWHCLE
jgi:hypothetical protein